MLSVAEKEKIIAKYRLHGSDTGSAEVQIAILTEELKRLADHLKKHPKDINSRRGLLSKVIQRKRLLNWLKRESIRRYNNIVRRLKIGA
jgi:small subunit ribosomal protein S15